MKKIHLEIVTVAAVVSSIIFVAACFARGPVSTFEAFVFMFVFNLPDSALPFFKAVTYIGTLGSLIALLIVAVYKQKWIHTILIIPAVALAYAATYLIKQQLVSRARPSELFAIIPREEMDVIARDGFPSGHVAVASLLALWLIILLPPKGRLWSLALPISVGIGRIYTGEHMPLDVIGGISLGILLGAVIELALRYVRCCRHMTNVQ